MTQNPAWQLGRPTTPQYSQQLPLDTRVHRYLPSWAPTVVSVVFASVKRGGTLLYTVAVGELGEFELWILVIQI